MMKKSALFCIDSTAYLRHIAPVIFRFAQSDIYTVEVILLGSKDKLKENLLDLLGENVSKINMIYATHRQSNLYFQELLALLLFLNPLHSSPLLINRTSFPRFFKLTIRALRIFPPLSSFIGKFLLYVVRKVYKLTLYTDPQYLFFRDYLRLNNFSFVFSAPYIFPNTRSVPLQLACKATATPLVGQIASWDNLTTKGTWVIKPDKFFVWNRAMKEQLSVLHTGINDVTSYHGSPTFESTKGYESPFSRQQFLEKLSLPPNSKYILYLCSSPTIGGHNEDSVISELVSSLLETDILNDNVYLVIRTHPLLNLRNSFVYNNSPSNVIFYPKYSTSPNSSAVDNDIYLSTIAFSSLVLGQNTSAFLDACLLDRPCITLPEYPGLYNPDKFGHIQLLLDGNFIHQPSSVSQLLKLISRILFDGGDSLHQNRSHFISSFLYPDSLSPSSSIFKDVSSHY